LASKKLQTLSEAQKDLSAGGAGRLKLAELEASASERKAKAEQESKDTAGNISDESKKILIEKKKLIDAETDRNRKAIALSIVQEQVATNLNNKVAETGIEYSDQLELQREKIAANEIEVAHAEKLFGVNSLIASQLRAQGQQLKIATNEMEYQHGAALMQARDAVNAMDAQLAGNKALADIERNRVQHAQAIRDALRAGNPALAEQLAKQQALGDLEARAKQLRRTPQQVRDDRKEQEAQDRAIRQINAIEKNNPNSRPADGRNRVSPAAARARAEFAARHALPNVAAAAQQLKDITANMIVVKQIKPA